jgi:aspartate/methionine/tyrosine aminotransferase
VTGARSPAFSQRLTWSTGENRLAQAEAAVRGAGRPVLDLTVSNPTEVGLPYPAAELAAALARPAVARYQPAAFGLSSARQAVAADYARRGAVLDPAAIVLTASSSESYALLFKLLANPGEVVLVPQPSYPLFDYLARLEGVEARPYRLSHDGGWRVDLDTLDLAAARAVCVVSPNNPTGSFVHRQDLEALAALAAERGLALVVDEVFADYAFAPGPGAVLSVAGAAPAALTFCLGGLSKSAGLPQMKLGWIATLGPAALVAEALARLELVCDTYLSPGTPVQLALSRLLELGASIRAAIRERVQANRRALASAISAQAPCTLLPAEAGWSAILRMPALMSDEDWAIRLLEEDGVLVQPGYFFDLTLGTTLVLSLLPAPATFNEGVSRLLARLALENR